MGMLNAGTDAVICVPATLLQRAHVHSRRDAGQDWGRTATPHRQAHTGDISAEMLKGCRCQRHVIVGHSERRVDREGDRRGRCRQKPKPPGAPGLMAVTSASARREESARRSAQTPGDPINEQIAGSVPASATHSTAVIAYEPVWAIGTRLDADGGGYREAHAHDNPRRAGKRDRGNAEAARMRILYGGSVKPSNAQELLVRQGMSMGRWSAGPA